MAESRKRDDDMATREQLRLVFAAMFMCSEIAGKSEPDSNEELAARGLRRADMLFKLHDASSKP